MTKAEDAIERQRIAEEATADEHEQAALYRRSADSYQLTIASRAVEHDKIQAEIVSSRAELKLYKTNLSNLLDGIISWIDEVFSARRQDIQDKFLEQARQAFERVRENDRTANKSYTRKAESEVDQQLEILDKYNDTFPDLPEAKEVRRRIIKP
ncbi:hypothetical protein B195_006470 [Pseudomonas sp. Lz4W]|uniref:hypothetical protein n=1 Tax=Pseudomonas sp. Lz4W TaxID=1206777 RepID=UPI0002BDAE1E|nr:hypothetical protein [Pseudomonas sp. Lz4W]AUB74478.1 hypothetical protein B195_006470 [Pseudomonas sp. Lz4W]